MANYFFIFTDVGINFALFAFVAVALGGFGSIIGCLYAGIIIGYIGRKSGLEGAFWRIETWLQEA